MSRRGLQVNTKCVFDQVIYLLPISKFSYHFPLDLSGYIRQVTTTKKSQKNNPYFDTSVATETSIEQLRVMISPSVDRNLFLEKFESKTPITLRNLSKSSKSRITFFIQTMRAI